MEIPRRQRKEQQRLAKAVARDSKHFLKCPKCGDWLDSRQLGNQERISFGFWRLCVLLGVVGAIGMLIGIAIINVPVRG